MTQMAIKRAMSGQNKESAMAGRPENEEFTMPERPENVLHDIANGISTVTGLLLNPQDMVKNMAEDMANEYLAKLTDPISKALPSFPAATLGSIAMGLPHAHVSHPPSGPPPAPPTPLIPMGPVMLGTCVQVLINGLPAARSGDMGFNPTCCGLPPMFEIITGSSKVFIGGARAARVIDITYHCKSEAEEKNGPKKTDIAPHSKPKGNAMPGPMSAIGYAPQALSVSGDVIEADKANEEGDAAMAEALAISAAMNATQLAGDIVSEVAGALMGMDPCTPPGTLGAITTGSFNVLIGGFPMPGWGIVAKGLSKLVKGLIPKKKGAKHNNKNKGSAG